jgi:nuclear pore complex protein Nup155
MTVAAQQGDTDGTDYILCLAPDLTRIGALGQLNLPQQQPLTQQQQYGSYPSSTATSRPPLTEYATLLAIPGRTWAMATVPRSPLPTTTPGASAPVAINELALQFSEPPRQFMLLTNVGLTFLTKRRALDYLKAVLEELQSEGNVQPIIEFRDR